MKLLEYQSKKVLREYGLPVPASEVVFSVDEVEAAFSKLGFESGVCKAQAYTGGRGKAGGVKLYKNLAEAKEYTEAILKMTLVTKQTGPEGTAVHGILLEELSDIKTELYVAITMDRAKSNPVIMLCPEGGMEIEEIAEATPEKILKQYPSIGEVISSEMALEGAKFLGVPESMYGEFEKVINNLYRVFQDKDCSLLEINPLNITGAETFGLLDCKFDVDDNALFRQKDLGGDPNADLNEAEIEAAKYGLSYIQLDGNIGCMVNGAGLAMATMDIIQVYGEEPANFLDVGGSASEEAVSKAFQIITSDKNVKGLLVNIFGGIMKCDTIATGIINAAKGMELKIPLVVRLSGTNSVEGQKLIDESGLALVSASTLSEAAEKIVSLLKESN